MRWLAAAILLAATPAAAHQGVVRELVMQVDARGAVALWHLRAVGPRALMTVALGDRDRNGVLDEGERAVAAVSMLRSAAHGVLLSWDGVRLSTTGLEARLETEGERSAAAVGLATLRLPSAAAGTHTLRIELDEASAPLAFQIQVLDEWQLSKGGARLSGDGRGFARPLVLSPGRAIEIEITATRGR